MKNGWEIKKLSEVCSVIAGQSPEGKYYNANFEGLPFYQGKKEFKDKHIGEPTKWTTKVTKEAIAGDILMSVRAPVGPVNFATQKICIGRGLAAIRATESLENDYLFYYFIKHENEIVGNEGAVFNSINKTQIENLNVPIPPIPEQKRIVKILDEAFAAINKAKANAEKNLQNSRELFDSYLNKVFANPSTSLGTGPGEDWEEKKLVDVCTLQRGFDLPKRLRKNGKFPLASSSGIIDTHYECKVKGPGVVTGRSGSVGNVFHVFEDFWPLNTVLYVKDFHGNDSMFVYHLLKQFGLKKYASGAGVPTLNRNNVHDELVKVPASIDEQKQIVIDIEKLSTQIKSLETNYQQKLSDLEELKKSILQKAFEGEL